MVKEKQTTSVQIYCEDLEKLSRACGKRENFRDKLHEIIKQWKPKR